MDYKTGRDYFIGDCGLSTPNNEVRFMRLWIHSNLFISKRRIAITRRTAPVILIVHILFLSFVLSLAHPTEVFAHGGKVSTMGGEMNQAGEESLIISKYIEGPVIMKANPELDQWKQSFETHIKSMWRHDIAVRTINNGTHIFFLISWYDPTVNDTNVVTN
ncbi:MAG TPA: hypothetical protein VF884_12720, partial [Nitrososphaeraceae archaeon]